MTRPSWHDTWMDVAEVVSLRSDCSRAKHGAVIVSPTNRIISTGYNGPPRGFIKPMDGCENYCPRAISGEYRTDYDNCYSIHAESNAIAFADRRDMEGGTIYVNGMCCYTCAKLICNSGIALVVLKQKVEQAYRVSKPVMNLFYASGIEVSLYDGSSD